MRRSLAITVGALGALWLASLAVLLCYLSDIVTTPWLVGATVAQIAVFGVASALLLVTNTRRPAGIDPNAPPRRVDPFGQTTDEVRDAVLLPDARPYGRRAHDDRNVVARLSDILEEEAAKRKPGDTPAWVVSMNQRHEAAGDVFSDTAETQEES